MKKTILLFVIVMLSGCVNDISVGPDKFYSECFIREYDVAYTMQARQTAPSALYVFPDSLMSLHTYDEGFKTLQDKNDDYHYNGYMYMGDKNPALANSFSRIEIVSDREFNGIFPGESLASKVRIVARSASKWLASGGLLTYDWSNKPSDYLLTYEAYRKPVYQPQLHPVYKLISDLEPSDLYLLSAEYPAIGFVFTESPSVKEQTITIFFHEDGNEIKTSTAMVFE